MHELDPEFYKNTQNQANGLKCSSMSRAQRKTSSHAHIHTTNRLPIHKRWATALMLWQYIHQEPGIFDYDHQNWPVSFRRGGWQPPEEGVAHSGGWRAREPPKQRKAISTAGGLRVQRIRSFVSQREHSDSTEYRLQTRKRSHWVNIQFNGLCIHSIAWI